MVSNADISNCNVLIGLRMTWLTKRAAVQCLYHFWKSDWRWYCMNALVTYCMANWSNVIRKIPFIYRIQSITWYRIFFDWCRQLEGIRSWTYKFQWYIIFGCYFDLYSLEYFYRKQSYDCLFEQVPDLHARTVVLYVNITTGKYGTYWYGMSYDILTEIIIIMPPVA